MGNEISSCPSTIEKGGHKMKAFYLFVIISMLLTSTALADTVTVLDMPAGIYDAVHAKFAVNRHNGKAYVKVFLMDESSYSECWGNQSALQGISSDKCRVFTKRVAVPGLAYDPSLKANLFSGGKVEQDALVSDVYYKNIDDGVSTNSVKHVRVRLQTP
jgi:hypothetical protein